MNDFKRRMIAISLSTMMAISTISAMSIYADDAEPTTPKLESGRLLGDVNKDGKISTADVGLANSHAKASKILVDEDFEAADVNNDKKITTADVGLINSHVKGVRLLDGSTPSPTDPSDVTDPTDPSESTEPTNPSLEDGELDFETGKAYLLSKYDELRTKYQNCLDNLPSEEEALSTIVIDNVETIVYPTLYDPYAGTNTYYLDIQEMLTTVIDYIDDTAVPNVDADTKEYLETIELVRSDKFPDEYYQEKFQNMTDVEIFDFESLRAGLYPDLERYRIKEDGTISNYLDFYSIFDGDWNGSGYTSLTLINTNQELGEKGKAWVEAIRAENLTDLEIIERANEYAIELYEQACGKLTEKANFDNIRFSTEIMDIIGVYDTGYYASTACSFIEDPEMYVNNPDGYWIMSEDGESYESYFYGSTVISLPAVVSALVEPFGIDLYCCSSLGGCDCLVYWDEETQTRYFTNVVLNAYYSSGLYGAEDINTYTNLTDPYDMSVSFSEFYSDVSSSIPKTSLGREVKRLCNYKGTESPFNKYYGSKTYVPVY